VRAPPGGGIGRAVDGDRAESSERGDRRERRPAACARTVHVSLGSNLGHREGHLRAALDALDARCGVQVVRASALYETDPVGPPPQGPYLNAVAELRTSLAPRALLDALLEIERQRGRERQGRPRWSARPLDLDLLLYERDRIDEPGLRVPHPRLHERAFVLVPLAELAPGLEHPELGRSIAALARRAVEESPASVRPYPAGEVWRTWCRADRAP